jgi:hypothetical protein
MKTTKTQSFLKKSGNKVTSINKPLAVSFSILQVALFGVFLSNTSVSFGQDSNYKFVNNGSGQYTPVLAPPQTDIRPVSIVDGAYAANSLISRINITVRNAGVPADGVSVLDLEVEVFDKNDQLLKDTVLLTLESSGGRLVLQGTANDEFGVGRNDADRLVPGTQIRVTNGKAYFGLIAPGRAQDVTVRLTGGAAQLTGVIPFNPDLKQMIAAGFLEGAIRLDKKNYASTISPARLNDGFEQEISRFSRVSTISSANGLNETTKNVAGRAALFLKGKISGNSLLTMTVDSDKAQAARLLSNIKPDEYYAAYGDASVRGSEGKSSDRLYIRIDNQRSFILYGDFNTADGFSQVSSGGIVAGSNLRQLATYNRSLTGIRAHGESKTGFLNAYAAYDTLKSVTEELGANGTSGPFAINNNTALENSEKIELIVRDKNNLSRVLSVVPMSRLIDYTFEPFSARILFNRAIPSFDISGNPMSVRISYEVDQGGEKFIVAGLDGQINIGESAVIGGAIIQDKNPNAPAQMIGLNGAIQLNKNTTLIAEIAQSKSTPDAIALRATIALPSKIPSSSVAERSGTALRMAMNHDSENLQAKIFYNRSEAGFSNQSNGASSVVDSLGSGNQQIGSNVSLKATETLTLKAEAQWSKTLDSDASNRNVSIGADFALSSDITLRAAIRNRDEKGLLSSTNFGINCNPSAGSAYSSANGGGFTGASSSTILNLNGSSCALGSIASAGKSTTVDRSSNTVLLGADVKLNSKLTVTANLEAGKSQEAGVSTDSATRLELAASYQLFERTRLYSRVDTQRGLASQYSLDTSSKSSGFSMGVDSTYMQGGNVFTEFRVLDGHNAAQAQIATGLRNVFSVSEGLLVSTGIERLKLLSKTGQNASAASLGLDYSQSPLWKVGGKLEWRSLDNTPTASSLTATTPTINKQDTTLFTLSASRKMQQDWTFLARNYYLSTDNKGVTPNSWQDRLQLGFAYRPEDNNKLDVLSKLEYKTENNINSQGEYRKVTVAAVQASYHPSRTWWMSARLAAKQVDEKFPAIEGGSKDAYKAFLLGGRLGYDITENIDVSLNLSLLSGKAGTQSGSSQQKGIGLELGYLLATNVWASVGFNFSGYVDKDLSNDYSGRGLYLKLRYKFDQDLFQAGNPAVNNSLVPPVSAAGK